MSEEKLYVICEVEQCWNKPNSIGLIRYDPSNQLDAIESMYLNPSRIIKQSQLRYDIPKIGELAFFKCGGLHRDKVELRKGFRADEKRLIIDPPKEPKSVWDQWAEECPACCNEETKKAVAEWLKREPEKD